MSRLLNPPELSGKASERLFEAAFRAGLTQDEEGRAVLEAHPGLLDHVLASVRPVFRKIVERQMHATLARYASFYEERFTADELTQLITFYSSPLGKKLIAGIYAGMDMDAMMNRVSQRGEDTLSPGDVRTLNCEAVQAIAPAFNEAELADMTAFMQGPLGTKIIAATPAYQRLTAEIANYSDPADEVAIVAAVRQAFDEFLAKTVKSKRG